MIVFRCLTSEEILNSMQNKKTNTAYVKGNNTFSYEEKTSYKHFFYFAEHAYYYKNLHKRIYPVIGEYVIPNEIIEQTGFGFYGDVKTMRNQNLEGFYMPLPEILVKTKDMKKEYLYQLFSELYGDFVSKTLDKFNTYEIGNFVRLDQKYDNSYYNEPMEEDLSINDSRGYLDYSYADIYYEMVYELLKQNDWKMDRTVKILKNYNLHEEIPKYFYEHIDLFREQTKRYVKEQERLKRAKKKRN